MKTFFGRNKTHLGATHKRVLIGMSGDGSYKFKDIPITTPSLIKQVLEAQCEFVKRNHMRPDMLLVNCEQMRELMQQTQCLDDYIFGLKMLPYGNGKLKVFIGNLR